MASFPDRFLRVRRPRERVAEAAEALGRYKLRTGLSVLGVVLGIAAVIAMMSVAEGARREALTQVQMMGLDNLVVRARLSGPAAPGVVRARLSAADAGALLRLVPLVDMISPLVERYLSVSYGGRRTMARVLGVRASYQEIVRLGIRQGRLLSIVDERASAAVCVIGAPLARVLFGYRDPIGQTLAVGGQYYRVVGVLAEQGTTAQLSGALAWRDLNQALLVPITTAMGRSAELADRERVDELWIRVADDDRVEVVGGIVAHTLNGLHGGQHTEVIIPRELLAQRFQTQRTFSVVVGSIAVIALLVGGIGIMNIMLTSVVERTREIGLRRTVGATRRDITVQFLTESLLMTVSGGAFGVVLGILSASGITAYAGWRTHISWLAIVLALIVSAAVGLGFGLFPAVRAARLEPVDAVRYE